MSAKRKNTCLACKQVKRKCDRGSPCSRCERLGLECVEQARGPGRPWPKKGAHHPDAVRSRAACGGGRRVFGVDGDDDNGGGESEGEGSYVVRRANPPPPAPPPRPLHVEADTHNTAIHTSDNDDACLIASERRSDTQVTRGGGGGGDVRSFGVHNTPRERDTQFRPPAAVALSSSSSSSSSSSGTAAIDTEHACSSLRLRSALLERPCLPLTLQHGATSPASTWGHGPSTSTWMHTLPTSSCAPLMPPPVARGREMTGLEVLEMATGSTAGSAEGGWGYVEGHREVNGAWSSSSTHNSDSSSCGVELMVPRPRRECDLINHVTRGLTNGMMKMMAEGLVDPNKLRHILDLSSHFSNRVGRDVSWPVRPVLEWAAKRSLPATHTHNGAPTAAGAERILRMVNEGGCCLTVRYGGPTVAEFFTTPLLSRFFLSAEDIAGFFAQTSLVYVYAWSKFLDVESIDAMYNALCMMEFTNTPGPIDVGVKCITRDGRCVRCIASLGRVLPTAHDPNSMLVLRLWPVDPLLPPAPPPLQRQTLPPTPDQPSQPIPHPPPTLPHTHTRGNAPRACAAARGSGVWGDVSCAPFTHAMAPSAALPYHTTRETATGRHGSLSASPPPPPPLSSAASSSSPSIASTTHEHHAPPRLRPPPPHPNRHTDAHIPISRTPLPPPHTHAHAHTHTYTPPHAHTASSLPLPCIAPSVLRDADVLRRLVTTGLFSTNQTSGACFSTNDSTGGYGESARAENQEGASGYGRESARAYDHDGGGAYGSGTSSTVHTHHHTSSSNGGTISRSGAYACNVVRESSSSSSGSVYGSSNVACTGDTLSVWADNIHAHMPAGTDQADSGRSSEGSFMYDARTSSAEGRGGVYLPVDMREAGPQACHQTYQNWRRVPPSSNEGGSM